MSESKDSQSSGSFTHAFLPGLILGLVIGAVAGAFLPDWLGGSKIPAPAGDPSAVYTDRDERLPERDETGSPTGDQPDEDGDPADPIDPEDPPADDPDQP